MQSFIVDYGIEKDEDTTDVTVIPLYIDSSVDAFEHLINTDLYDIDN